MKTKWACCAGLVLSMICVIGCAARDTQIAQNPVPETISPQAEMPAVSEPQPVSQQVVQVATPVATEQDKVTDAPVIAKTGVTQAAPEPTTAPSNPSQDIPSATVHAKTGYVEPEPEPTPEPDPAPVGTADRQAAMDAANAYAVTTYGVETDGSLTLDNSAYRFPASVPADATQATLEAKARDMVDFTFRQLMMQAGVDTLADAGFRCNVCIMEDGGSLLIYVLYDG